MTIYLYTCTLTLTELFYQIVPQLLYVAHDDDGLVLFFSACCTNEQKRERKGNSCLNKQTSNPTSPEHYITKNSRHQQYFLSNLDRLCNINDQKTAAAEKSQASKIVNAHKNSRQSKEKLFTFVIKPNQNHYASSSS